MQRNRRLRITSAGKLDDTLATIKLATTQSIPQTRMLAKELRRGSLKASAKAIYEYVVQNIRYKLDQKGVEEIRTAARTIADRKTGVDCEDYSILIAAILINLGYRPVYEVVDLNSKRGYDHIYVVGYDAQGNSVIIDPTPHPLYGPVPFDTRPQGIRKTMVVELLSGVGNNGHIAGMGDTPSNLTQGLIDQQSRLIERARAASPSMRSRIARNARKLRLAILLDNTPEQAMVLDLWDAILDVNASGEIIWARRAIREVEEYLQITEAVEASPLADPSMDQLQGLGFIRRSPEKKAARQAKREAKQKAKDKSRNATRGATKAGHIFNRLNPATVAARNAFLLAMKNNVLNIAEVIKWGYLAENEVRQKGFDLAEWRKVKAARERAEKVFFTLGGKPQNLRDAILKGGGGLSGLGAIPIAAIPALVGAASKFLKPIAEWINKHIKLDKLFARVKKGKEIVQKIQKTGQKAQEELQRLQKQAKSGTSKIPFQTGVNVPEELDELRILVRENEPKGSSGDSANIPWGWIAGGLAATAAIFLVIKN